MVPTTTGSAKARSIGSSRNPVCSLAFHVHARLITCRLGSIDPIERPFTPDGSKDLASVWKRQGVDQVTPDTKRLAKPNALMFFHIPLYVLPSHLGHMYHSDIMHMFPSQESYLNADVDSSTGKPLDVGISDLEGKGSAKGNAGFFEKGLMTALESNHRSGGVNREVKVVANGHCHSALLIHFATYVDSTTAMLQSPRTAGASKAHGCALAVEGTHGVISPELLKR
jgi:hypothetical protein